MHFNLFEVAIPIDEGLRGVGDAFAVAELAVPAELSRMRGQENVGGPAPQRTEAAVEVGPDPRRIAQ